MAIEKRIGLFLGPALFLLLLLIPVPEGLKPEAWRVIAMGAWMISWWVTEAVALPVTALLPLILLPMLGVSDLKTAAAPYSNPVVYLFFGGFVIALAMEKWNLHRRIALNIVRRVGTNANGIIFGFFLSTFFISMWISNTATTVMMLPIALSVIDLLTKANAAVSERANVPHFALGILLAITYASSIGGMATVIGTPPNVVAKGYLLETFNYEVSFASWLMVAFPFALLFMFITYFLVVRVFYPNRLGDFEGAEELIQREVEKLGPMSAGEKRTLVVFLAAAVLWIFQSLINQAIPGLRLSDEGIAIMAAVALFLMPIDFKKGEMVLEWRDTSKLAWGILLLFGGGLSLADALSSTGIIKLIGDQFAGIENNEWLVVAGLVAVSVFLTEIMSNVAQVTVFLPVVGAMAQGMGMSPFEVCIPVTLAASAGFMLPMSTPPNAIVFASGHVKIGQMIRIGFWLNLIAIALIVGIVYPMVKWIF